MLKIPKIYFIADLVTIIYLVGTKFYSMTHDSLNFVELICLLGSVIIVNAFVHLSSQKKGSDDKKIIQTLFGSFALSIILWVVILNGRDGSGSTIVESTLIFSQLSPIILTIVVLSKHFLTKNVRMLAVLSCVIFLFAFYTNLAEHFDGFGILVFAFMFASVVGLLATLAVTFAINYFVGRIFRRRT